MYALKRNIPKFGAWRDFLPFVQFKKRKRHTWRNVNFIKVAPLLKLTPLHGFFSRCLNCTNSTKSSNASQMILYYMKLT